MATPILEFEKFNVSLVDNAYFDVVVFPHADMYAADAAQMVAACNELSGNVQRPALVVVGEFANFNTDAREFTADPSRETASTAIAYVLTSLAQRMVANFFIRFNKPVKPVKFFRDRASALAWLEEFMQPK